MKSFSRRLTRNITIIVLITMTAISMAVFFLTAISIFNSSKVHYADNIRNISRSLRANLEKVEISARNIADEVSWHISSPDDILKTLSYEINVNRNLTGCGLAFTPGYFPEKGTWFEPYATIAEDKPFVKDIGSAEHNYLEAEWYKSALENEEGIWSKPYLDSDGAGTLLCTYCLPVTPTGGKETVGVLGADMSLMWLTDRLYDIDKLENEKGLFSFMGKNLGIYSFILGNEGEYLAHPDRERVVNLRSFFDYVPGKRRAKEEYNMLGFLMCSGMTGEETVVLDGRNYTVFFAPISNYGWSMAIAVPLKTLLIPAFMFGGAILLLILLGVVIVNYRTHGTIQKFSKPLIQLSGSASQVAQGNFDTALPEISHDDEIRLLRDSFDNMQQSLSRYIVQLSETTAQKASIENELNVARKIQMSMIPRTWPAFPERNDIDIYGSVIPARAVGGDLFDFILRDDKLHFCIGDVSGKGIPASLVMTVVSSLFRTLAAKEDGPDKLVTIINNSMSKRNENMMFVTFLAGELNLKTGEIKYCNAGHNDPIILRGGKSRLLGADPNVPLGIESDWKYSIQRTTLNRGETLFLYTDGITEATRSDGTLFGEERTLERLSGQPDFASAESIALDMKDAVQEFVSDAEQSDDITMLIIKSI